MQEKKYLKWYNKVGYGSGDLAANMVYALLTSFVMIYLTDTVGLNAGIAGTLMMLSKFADGITDVFFGSLIDKTKSKICLLYTSIQTFVCEYNEEMVREAIVRELTRDGQVYYVYNRVNTIADVAAAVQQLVPEAVVAFAHGQMKEHELERIMYDFINGEIDVLVATTIIETGLDISNVNTMIIHDADQLGLSQLYQLRGDVYKRQSRNSAVSSPPSISGEERK